MGTLFPKSDEHPDHDPIPTSLPRASLADAGTPILVVAALYAHCPKNEDRHLHVPHREFVAVEPLTPSIQSGTSSDAMPWLNNSTEAAADVVIHARRACEDAHTRMASSSGSTGLDL